MNNIKKNILNSLLVLFVTIILSPAVNARQVEKNQSPETIEELRTAILQVLEETGTPAAGIALVDSTGPVWIEGLGKADVEQNIDANEESMFRIASTSKIFVALAILHLQEQGILSLKDRVSDLIPEIEFTNPWEDINPILVEHLLEHTTGWDDIHALENYTDGKGRSLREALDMHPHSRISRWVPGTRASYSNSGPAVAAFIVEKLTGKTYENFIQENFFDPLGMESMTFYQSEEYKQKGVTLYIEGHPIDFYSHYFFRPSAAMNASPKDMANMVTLFVNRGMIGSTRLISDGSLQRMETPSTTLGAKAGLKYGYGLCLYTSDYNGYTYYKHGGTSEGGRSDFSYLPEYGLGYSLLINSSNGQAMDRIGNLIREYQTKNLPKPYLTNSSLDSTVFYPQEGYYQQINPRNSHPLNLSILFTGEFWIEGDTLYSKYPVITGRIDKYIPVADSLYQSQRYNKTNLAVVNDPLVGDVLEIAGSQGGTFSFGRVNGTLLLLKIVILGLWILLLLKAILWLPFWGYKYWRGRIQKGPNVQVRLWPVLAGFAFLITVILMFFVEALPGSIIISFLLLLCTIPFVAASIYSVIVVLKNRNEDIKRSIYFSAAILSVLHIAVASYLLWYRLSEVMLWA